MTTAEKTKKLIVIVGPTASGKSKFGVAMAEAFAGEIISADASQIYQYMDIGTAKVTKEEMIGPNGSVIPHHMIDIFTPDTLFTVADFQKQARAAIADIQNRGKVPFLVGGSGLYVNAVTDCYVFTEEDPQKSAAVRKDLQQEWENKGGAYLYAQLQKIDPQAAMKIHENDKKRVIRALEVYRISGKTLSQQRIEQKKQEMLYDTLFIGLQMERSLLYERINQRVDKMMADGLLSEIMNILALGYPPTCNALQALGYRQLIFYLFGLLTLPEAIAMIKRDTRHFAKRQLTWFKRDDRIQWFSIHPDQEEECYASVAATISSFLAEGEKDGHDKNKSH